MHTDCIDGALDLRTQDLVPLVDADDFVAIVRHGAERMGEACIAGEVLLDGEFLVFSIRRTQTHNHACDLLLRVVHRELLLGSISS